VSGRFRRAIWRLLGGGDPDGPPDDDAWVEVFHDELMEALRVLRALEVAHIEARLVDQGYPADPRKHDVERRASVEVRNRDLEPARRRIPSQEVTRIFWDGDQPRRDNPFEDLARFATVAEAEVAASVLAEAGIGSLLTEPEPEDRDQRTVIAVDEDDLDRAAALLRDHQAIGGPRSFRPLDLPGR
jgi:hypothetical protein